MNKKIYLPLIAVAAILFTLVGFNSSTSQTTPVRLKKGDIAPELIFKDPEGKELKLSDLKGSIVLIDFWASWCGPCRMTNPSVVALYNKYKDIKCGKKPGFVVFNVSFDTNAEAWKKAILKDGLVWPYHISDLKGWSAEPGKLYGVQKLPTTFLVDEKGVIIGKDLLHEDIEFELEKRLKKK